MKANYRKSMPHSLLAAIRKFNTATEFAKSVTVFNAIWWISSAWNNVQEETICVASELVLRCQKLTSSSRKTTQASPI